MNILPLLPDKVRAALGKEAGRTMGCKTKTNLVVHEGGRRFPICSSCITANELKRATSIPPDSDHLSRCHGVRIIGESGRDYRMGQPNIDIRGIYTKDEAEKIRRNGHHVFTAAAAILANTPFSVALVSYSDLRYRIFGSRTGPEFPIGSKLLLAELPFEIVGDRFEAQRPRIETVNEFDRLIRESVKRAVDNFKTDVVDQYDEF